MIGPLGASRGGDEPCVRAARRSRRATRLVRAGRWSLSALLLAGACSDRANTDEPPPDRPSTPATAPASDEPIVVEADLLAQELDAAIAEARRTAGAARERWVEELLRARRDGSATDPLEPLAEWSIKWAAPLKNGDGRGGAEHVWVRPLKWSPQRIEGVLLSTPRREVGAVAGDVVAFPVAELSDWMRDDGATREGGFTVDVLERWSRRE